MDKLQNGISSLEQLTSQLKTSFDDENKPADNAAAQVNVNEKPTQQIE